MLYIIVAPFSPNDGERWTSYCEWRGMHFERFESIDGVLRPNLFLTPEEDDWAHVVKEDFMLHFITDHPHALKKREQIGRGDLVGVKFEDHDTSNPCFLGFDLLDGYCDISLLTNWGNDVECVNRALAANALILQQPVVEDIRRELLQTHGDDPHVEGCSVVSVYRPG